MIEMIFPALLTIIFAEVLWQMLLTFWDLITYKRKKDMSDKYVTLDKFMNERGEWVKQVVYKVDGDFNGDIKGDNVTVILMGDGDFVGDIDSKDGEVVVIKGDINGDVKANKVLCPTDPKQVKCSDCVHAEKQRFISLSGNRECNVCSQFGVKVNDNYRNCQLYKPVNRHNDDSTTKHNPAKDVESPKLPVKTMLSCDIPQGRIDYYTSIGDRVSIYGSSPVTHITCPYCKKHFATQLRVQTSVVDGDVVETRVWEIKRDY